MTKKKEKILARHSKANVIFIDGDFEKNEDEFFTSKESESELEA